MSNSIRAGLRLTWYAREEEGEWVAGCPSLDVYTQADSRDEARSALRETIELWLDSCLERETLPAALQELGWSRVERQAAAGNSDSLSVPTRRQLEDLLNRI